MTRTGLPHSEMYGSLPACGSPYLFAAYRVLHRLMAPRHPPYALSSLTIQLTKNIYVPSLVNSSLLSHRLEVPCHLINNKVFVYSSV